MSSSVITKKALGTALKQLMATQPLDKISVQDIVDQCGLNRQTFYYHFEDKFALLSWIYQSEALENIADFRNYATWTEGLHRIFQYIVQNKAFCANTLNTLVGRNSMDQYLYDVTNDLIMGVLKEVSAGIEIDEKDKNFIANFYTVAFTGLTIHWIKTGMKETPEELVERLNFVIEGSMRRAVERYASSAPSAGSTIKVDEKAK